MRIRYKYIRYLYVILLFARTLDVIICPLYNNNISISYKL